MSNVENNLNKILNIENIPKNKQDVISIEPIVENISDTQTDYDLTRHTIHNLLRKGETALDELIFVAKESESPRAYEVISGMIKNLSDVTKELIELQTKMKSLKEETSKSIGGVNVQNAVFVGSTAELQKLIRQSKEQDD